MNDEIIAKAAELLKISRSDAALYSRPVPGTDAMYFCNPIRGGNAVIIDANGEKLGATSGVSYQEHVDAFISGRRN